MALTATTRWTVRNLLLLLVAIVPALAVMNAVSTTIAGYDPTAASPVRIFGDLVYLYPALAVVFVVGGVVQSLLTIAVVRMARGYPRLVAVALAPLALLPFVSTGLINLHALFQAIPMTIAVVSYAILIGTPPAAAQARR